MPSTADGAQPRAANAAPRHSSATGTTLSAPDTASPGPSPAPTHAAPAYVASPVTAARRTTAATRTPASVATHRTRLTGEARSRVSRPAGSSPAVAAIRVAANAPSGTASRENIAEAYPWTEPSWANPACAASSANAAFSRRKSIIAVVSRPIRRK